MGVSTLVTTPLSILLLSAWIITALVFTVLNSFASNTTKFEVVASTSLFTFLICRLYVAFTPADTASLAHTLITAPTRSRIGALTQLLLAASWLYELYLKFLTLVFATALGATLALVMWHDALIESSASRPSAGLDELSKVESFKQSMKLDALEKEIDVDFATLLRGVSPVWLVGAVLAVWGDILSLGVYLVRLGWKGARGVLLGGEGEAVAPPGGRRMDGVKGPGDAGDAQGGHGVQCFEAVHMDGMSGDLGIQSNDSVVTPSVNTAQANARGVWISWGY
ncbi:hypothetical protein BDW75DRAFT_176171 [Aspergillus navahoensis]